MDPVDAAVREHEEERELEVVVGAAKDPDEGVVDVGCVVVDEAVAPYFGHEEGKGEDGHYWHRLECLLDFQLHLVLEVFRVLECCLVEDEDVR